MMKKFLLVTTIFLLAVFVVFITVRLSGERQIIQKEAEEANAVSLLIVPENNAGDTISQNTQFIREIRINNPTATPITNYQLMLTFPTNLLNVVSIDTSMSPVPTEVYATFDNTQGNIKLSRVDFGSTPTTQITFTVARVTFRAVASSGTAAVPFTETIVSGITSGTSSNQLPITSTTNGQYVLSGTGPTSSVPTATLTPSLTPTRTPTVTMTAPTATLTPTRTPTRTPTPTTPSSTSTPVNITINLPLQGRTYTGASKTMDITIQVKNTTTQFVVPSATATNFALTGLTPGQYTFIISPKGYLSREIPVTLVAGNNSLNLSSVVFCAGDIDGSGQINSFDSGALILDFKKSNVPADLDGSTVVNALDFSLLLGNYLEDPSTADCTL